MSCWIVYCSLIMAICLLSFFKNGMYPSDFENSHDSPTSPQPNSDIYQRINSLLDSDRDQHSPPDCKSYMYTIPVSMEALWNLICEMWVSAWVTKCNYELASTCHLIWVALQVKCTRANTAVHSVHPVIAGLHLCYFF